MAPAGPLNLEYTQGH